MTESDLSYNVVAGIFVIALTLMATAGLRVDYASSRKPYLGWACVAGIIAVVRQVPDGFLGVYPDSNLFYLASSSLQFLATLAFLVALLRVKGELVSYEKTALAVLVVAWIGVGASLAASGLPQSPMGWYLVSGPSLVASLLIFLQVFRVSMKSSTSRVLLLVSSFAVLAIRASLPSVESIEMVYLVYFIEIMLFPVMLTALHLSEVQTAYEKVKALLRRRTQSEENVQFILDNSMDIIVAVSSSGLLTTWNKGAEAKFGYTSEQAIGKVHIDDLFIDHYCHRDVEEYREFDAWMENVNGETIAVRVRIKTVNEGGRCYTIYILRDLSAIDEISKTQTELERERIARKSKARSRLG